MTKEKLERAHEISLRIDHIKEELGFLEKIKDMLESYYRKELEKAKKEFEEI